MPDPDLLHRLIGLAAVVAVLTLTVPALLHVWKTSRLLRGGYIQLGGDEDNYEDRDGIATEDSIRAFTDTRPRVAVWLCTVIGLGASIAARIVLIKGTDYDHTDVLSELSAWTEPACWVRLAHTASEDECLANLSIGLPVLAVCCPAFQTPAPGKVQTDRPWPPIVAVGGSLCRPSSWI
jgi:hypothetical protein